MATTPPTSTDPLVHVKDDPDSLALRARLVAAEERLAAAVESANATQKLLVEALMKPPPAPVVQVTLPAAPITDAELWRGFAEAALAANPIPGVSASEWVSTVADGLLAQYQRRFPA